MRVLVVRQDKLGDLLLTTPLLRGLSQHVTVDLMAQPAWLPVGRRLSSVEQILPTPYRPGFFEAVFRLRRQMKFYDAVVLAKESSGDHTLAAWLARVPIRVGFTPKRYGRLLTRNLELPEDRHEVERLAILGGIAIDQLLPLTPLEFPPSTEEVQAIEDWGVDEFFIVAPMTGGTCPPWPTSDYEDLIHLIQLETGITCVLTGAPGEEPLVEPLARGSMRINAVGQLTLGELAAACQRAAFVVTGNSGTLHVAAAQGTPVLVIETSDRPEYFATRWGPWQCPGEHVFPPLYIENAFSAFRKLWTRLRRDS